MSETVGLEPVTYETGMQDMRDYVEGTILKALENPNLDIMPASMALRVLLASLRLADEE
jgi:hypothetical protein